MSAILFGLFDFLVQNKSKDKNLKNNSDGQVNNNVFIENDTLSENNYKSYLIILLSIVVVAVVMRVLYTFYRDCYRGIRKKGNRLTVVDQALTHL